MTNHHHQSKSERKGFIWLVPSKYSPLLKGLKTGRELWRQELIQRPCGGAVSCSACSD
ncbi:rCG63244 [Rattus norvegicus]|uniref:RCG63244 n=1 Tax=Rattus norvegicus TaxID=10116 RepID=A6JP19_RAT|nr:rCG63244 [Rattus norvegicus]